MISEKKEMDGRKARIRTYRKREQSKRRRVVVTIQRQETRTACCAPVAELEQDKDKQGGMHVRVQAADDCANLRNNLRVRGMNQKMKLCLLRPFYWPKPSRLELKRKAYTSIAESVEVESYRLHPRVLPRAF